MSKVQIPVNTSFPAFLLSIILAFLCKPAAPESVCWCCIFQHVAFNQPFLPTCQLCQKLVFSLSEWDRHPYQKSSCPSCHPCDLFQAPLNSVPLTLESKAAATDSVLAFTTSYLSYSEHVPHWLWAGSSQMKLYCVTPMHEVLQGPTEVCRKSRRCSVVPRAGSSRAYGCFCCLISGHISKCSQDTAAPNHQQAANLAMFFPAAVFHALMPVSTHLHLSPHLAHAPSFATLLLTFSTIHYEVCFPSCSCSTSPVDGELVEDKGNAVFICFSSFLYHICTQEYIVDVCRTL